MKTLLILATILFNMSFVGRSQNDLEKFNVKGEVKSIKTTKSFAITDSLGKDIYIPENVSFRTFNKKGNLIIALQSTELFTSIPLENLSLISGLYNVNIKQGNRIINGKFLYN